LNIDSGSVFGRKQHPLTGLIQDGLGGCSHWSDHSITCKPINP
jgi:hypothetical protein